MLIASLLVHDRCVSVTPIPSGQKGPFPWFPKSWRNARHISRRRKAAQPTVAPQMGGSQQTHRAVSGVALRARARQAFVPLFRGLRWDSAWAWNIFLRRGAGASASWRLNSNRWIILAPSANLIPTWLSFECSAGEGAPHQHQRFEFIFELKGRLALKVGWEIEFLDVGDSLYFDSRLPHGYRRPGTKSCSALVVTAE
jgi:mannose-6-phosphate isomerase-like protein (cupin superfamily)